MRDSKAFLGLHEQVHIPDLLRSGSTRRQDRWLRPAEGGSSGHVHRRGDSSVSDAEGLFGLRLRQTTGLVASLLRACRPDWAVPDFTTLSRRQKGLGIDADTLEIGAATPPSRRAAPALSHPPARPRSHGWTARQALWSGAKSSTSSRFVHQCLRPLTERGGSCESRGL